MRWAMTPGATAERSATPRSRTRSRTRSCRAFATVRFRLSVKDGGDENYYCPRVEWEWEDGTKGTEESDCPAFEAAEKQDHERIWNKSHQFWEPGNHVIKVKVYKGSKLIRTLDGKVEVSGEATPGRFRER